MYEMSMSPIPSPTVHFGENSRVSDFVHDDNRAMRVASALLDGGAYLVDTTLSEEDYFTWKSGVRAPCYCNCRYAVSDYRTRTVIAVEMAGMIQETFSRVDNIVGIANAGIPWATSVADQLELPMAYLRPDKKAHGIGGHVQGRIRKGSRIVIVDDLVASGGSLKSSITSLLSEVEVDILGVSSIINWGFMKMRDNLDGFQYVSLTSYPQIVMAATARGKVKQEDFSRLLDFYVDPSLGY